MAVNIEIGALRVSLISTETLPGMLTANPPTGAVATLSQHDPYIKAFSDATNGVGPLTLPWPTGATARGLHYFWYFYLKRQTPDTVQAETAWRRLLPFRLEAKRLKSTQGQPPAQASVETYSYPHGNAAVATLTIPGPLPLDGAVDKLVAAATNWTYTEGANGSPTPGDRLSVVMSSCLDRAAVARLGTGPRDSDPYGDTFSVSAVVQGQGLDPTLPVPAGGPVHQAIDACCTLQPTWRTLQLPPIEEAKVPTTLGAAGTILYARRHARMMWFPDLFTFQSDPPIHKIGCFHRNLSLAAMQTQSLLGLARWADESAAAGGSLSFETGTLVRNSAALLGMIYGGATDVYQSRSLSRQIVDSGLIPTIDRLRTSYGLKRLDDPSAAAPNS